MNTQTKQALLPIEVRNNRKGTFTKYHRMVDVYINGKFISTYEYNPFAFKKGKDIVSEKLKFSNLIAYRLGKANRLCCCALSAMFSYSGYSLSYVIDVWLGNTKTEFYDDTMDKLTNIMHDNFDSYSDKVCAPDPYDIESCLVSDAQCAMEAADFDDFCANLGYDTDSRKAFDIYNACKETAFKLSSAAGNKFCKLMKYHEKD